MKSDSVVSDLRRRNNNMFYIQIRIIPENQVLYIQGVVATSYWKPYYTII